MSSGMSETKPLRIPKEVQEQQGMPSAEHTPRKTTAANRAARAENQNRSPLPNHTNHTNRNHRPTRKKRKKFRFGCCLGRTLILAILLVFGAYSAGSLYVIGKLDKQPDQTRVAPSAAVYTDDGVKSVLLIASDGKNTADGMCLLSLSKYNHTATFTTIADDTCVNIPNHGANKLTAAYQAGGAALLTDTVQNNFCIAANDYIEADSAALAAIIDALGGIQTAVSDIEAMAINEMLRGGINAALGDAADADLLAGGGDNVKLNGKQALCFANLPELGVPQQEHPNRENTVLNSVTARAKLVTPAQIKALTQNALPLLKTSLSTAQLYWMSLKLPYLLLSYSTQEFQMPADGTFTSQKTSNGTAVLAVDFDANLRAFQETIQSP